LRPGALALALALPDFKLSTGPTRSLMISAARTRRDPTG
jgi:hypothetical protein